MANNPKFGNSKKKTTKFRLQNPNSSTLNRSVYTYGKPRFNLLSDESRWRKVIGESSSKRGLFDTDESYGDGNSIHITPNKCQLNGEKKKNRKREGLFSDTDSDDSIFMSTKITSKRSTTLKPKLPKKKKSNKNSISNYSPKMSKNSYYAEEYNSNDLFAFNSNKIIPKKKVTKRNKAKTLQPKKIVKKKTPPVDVPDENSITPTKTLKNTNFHEKNKSLENIPSRKCEGLFSDTDSDDSIFMSTKITSKRSTTLKPKLPKMKKSTKNSISNYSLEMSKNSYYAEEYNSNYLFAFNSNKIIPKKKVTKRNKAKTLQPKKIVEKNPPPVDFPDENLITPTKTLKNTNFHEKNKSLENIPSRKSFNNFSEDEVTNPTKQNDTDMDNTNNKPTSSPNSESSVNIINASVVAKLDVHVNSRRNRGKHRKRYCSFKIKRGLSITSFEDEPHINNDLAMFDTWVSFDQNNTVLKTFNNHTAIQSFHLKSQLHSTPMARLPQLSNIRKVFNETELNLDASGVARQSTPTVSEASRFTSTGRMFSKEFRPFTPNFQLIPKFNAPESDDSLCSPRLPRRERSKIMSLQSPMLNVRSRLPMLILKDIADEIDQYGYQKPQKNQEIGTYSFCERTTSKKNVLEKTAIVSCRDHVLSACRQLEPRPFHDIVHDEMECKKLGEGVFGEVFRCEMQCGDVVALKVLPIEGDLIVNGEKQKTFSEILPEILISGQLSLLAYGTQNLTDGFIELYRAHCVCGVYPRCLISAWNHFDKLKTSENDHPEVFKCEQLYILLEYLIGGVDMEHFNFQTAAEAVSIIRQTIAALAVAEEQLDFEHRDLHWGNILVQRTNDRSELNFVLNGDTHQIQTSGVTSHIIDFTLSRMTREGCSLFQDLSCDPDLFKGDSTQDYQFEIYRMMKKEVGNDWSLYRPKTNLFWISYLLDKCINHIKYRYRRRKIHISSMKELQKLEKNVLKYSSCYDLFKNGNFFSRK